MADLEKEAARGTQAARVLDEPLLKEAFETLEARLIGTWQTTSDPKVRESLWYEQRALSKLRGHLKELVETGKLARKQLGQ
jgi:hypothetical protein